MAVLKRRLPSKLTQESHDENKKEGSAQEADFSVDLSAEQAPALPQEERSSVEKPTVPDPMPPADEIESASVEQAESSMKRQVKRRRPRDGSTTSASALMEEKDETLPETDRSTQAGKQERAEDLPPAQTRPDADTIMSESMASLKGEKPEGPNAPQVEKGGPGWVETAPSPPSPPAFDLSTRAEEAPAPEAEISTVGGAFEQAGEREENAEETSAPTSLEDDFLPPPSLAEQQEDTTPPVVAAPRSEGWELDEFSAVPGSDEAESSVQPPLPPTSPMADIYRDVTLDDGATDQKKREQDRSPPELPGSVKSAIGSMNQRSGGGLIKVLVIVAVALVIVVAVVLVRGGDQSRERLNRLGQSMAQVQEEIPTEDFQALENQMEHEMARMEAQDIPLAPPPVEGAGSQAAVDIDFLDVGPEEAEEPIMAEGEEDLPEDIGAIAKLQREIERLRDDHGEIKTSKAKAKPAAEGKAVEGAVSEREKIEEELAAYRQALVEAENVEELPKPSDFLANPQKFEEGGPRTVTAPAGDSSLPPSSLYESNPSDLPIIPEPEQPEEPSIRTLNDFDLALFEPERNRVRIPRGVRPRMSSTDFPQLDILSLIPDRGIVAVSRGVEGVLMIGESVEGWELLGVYQDYAEFRNGTRRHVVTRE